MGRFSESERKFGEGKKKKLLTGANKRGKRSVETESRLTCEEAFFLQASESVHLDLTISS